VDASAADVPTTPSDSNMFAKINDQLNVDKLWSAMVEIHTFGSSNTPETTSITAIRPIHMSIFDTSTGTPANDMCVNENLLVTKNGLAFVVCDNDPSTDAADKSIRVMFSTETGVASAVAPFTAHDAIPMNINSTHTGLVGFGSDGTISEVYIVEHELKSGFPPFRRAMIKGPAFKYLSYTDPTIPRVINDFSHTLVDISTDSTPLYAYVKLSVSALSDHFVAPLTLTTVWMIGDESNDITDVSSIQGNTAYVKSITLPSSATLTTASTPTGNQIFSVAEDITYTEPTGLTSVMWIDIDVVNVNGAIKITCLGTNSKVSTIQFNKLRYASEISITNCDKASSFQFKNLLYVEKLTLKNQVYTQATGIDIYLNKLEIADEVLLKNMNPGVNSKVTALKNVKQIEIDTMDELAIYTIFTNINKGAAVTLKNPRFTTENLLTQETGITPGSVLLASMTDPSSLSITIPDTVVISPSGSAPDTITVTAASTITSVDTINIDINSADKKCIFEFPSLTKIEKVFTTTSSSQNLLTISMDAVTSAGLVHAKGAKIKLSMATLASATAIKMEETTEAIEFPKLTGITPGVKLQPSPPVITALELVDCAPTKIDFGELARVTIASSETATYKFVDITLSSVPSDLTLVDFGALTKVTENPSTIETPGTIHIYRPRFSSHDHVNN
jgi:hypothetical protein